MFREASSSSFQKMSSSNNLLHSAEMDQSHTEMELDKQDLAHRAHCTISPPSSHAEIELDKQDLAHQAHSTISSLHLDSATPREISHSKVDAMTVQDLGMFILYGTSARTSAPDNGKPTPNMTNDMLDYMSCYFGRWLGNPGGTSKGPNIPPLMHVPIAFVGAFFAIFTLGMLIQNNPLFPQILAGAFGSQVKLLDLCSF